MTSLTGAAGRLARTAPFAVLAAVCYLPFVASGRGQVVPDTKPYLYLDPGRLLQRAMSLWDPGIGLGTVTHQTIGYLWPMGPFYWTLDAIGLPDWLAQRLWMGSVLFAAGTGMLFLLRTFGIGSIAGLAGALPYLLTPYVIGYAGVSAILLPYAGLPWLVALMVRGLRRGGWRHAAAFALVVMTVGSINATALLCAAVGAALWLPFAIWSTREVSATRAAGVLARFGALTLATQLWWLVALFLDGTYGSSILEVTETIEATAATSLSSEAVRGLGYWFFYGGDRVGPWVPAAVSFQTRPWLIALGFAIPVVACAAAALLRWSIRTYAVVLVAVGTAIAVGAHPFAAPAPLGRLLKAFAESSSFGLALRNSQRAVPLVVLGFSLLVAGAVASVARRSPRAGALALLAVSVLTVAANPAHWNGSLIDERLAWDEDIPGYWRDATRWLDDHDDGSRVLEIPGSDFASYRWGTTTDPVTPGLMDRPSASKELVPSGSTEAVDMVSALDRRLQEGIFEPAALAPMARLMGVGDVLLRSDLQYERYRTPRPRTTWHQLSPPPTGLAAPIAFGPPVANRPIARLPMEDEIDLALPASSPEPPPIAVFGVDDRVPIVRAKAAAPQLVVAGDAEGLVDLAAAGIIDGDELVRFSSGLAGDRRALDSALAGGGPVVVTDSNRRRARRWTTVRENYGFTEPEGFVPLDPDDTEAEASPIPTAGGAADTAATSAGGDASRTVVEYRGIGGVAATAYGNIISYTPEHRPYNAVDGDPETAWRVGAFTNPVGARWRLDLERPTVVDRVTLLQPQTGQDNRFLTRVSLRLDNGPWKVFALSSTSRSPSGEELRFPRRSVRRVEVRVDRTNTGTQPVYDGLSAVGIAELRVGGVVAEEVVRVPTDVLARPEAVAGRPLWIALTRNRTDPAVPVRTDEEPILARTFELPAPRSFGFETTVRLSALAPDEVLDEILGLPQPGSAIVRARSSGRLPGDVRSRAYAAIDGDPATAWTPGFLEQRGKWIEVTMARPLVLDRLDLQVVADGKHSAPTRVRITNERGETRDVDIAPVQQGGRGHVVTQTLSFPKLEATTLRMTVVDVAEDRTSDYFSTERIVAPVGIAELGLPGPASITAPDAVPETCRQGLLTVDGQPVGVRLSGTRVDAEGRLGLRATPCDGTPVALGPGRHDIRAAPGKRTGLDVDRVVLASGAGGEPLPTAGPAVPSASSGEGVPRLRVSAPTRSALRIVASGAREPFWLVLGQSRNRGWEATANGRALPDSSLVDGFANGWLIDPSGESVVDIDLEWRPQRTVRLALGGSFAGALLCAGVLVSSLMRRRRDTETSLAGRERPLLGLHPEDGGLSQRAVALRLCGVAGFALLVVPVAHALLVVGLAALVASAPRARRGLVRMAMVAAAAAALAGSGLYVAVLQLRHDYPPGFQWPREFSFAHGLTWIGILLLVSEAAIGARVGEPVSATEP